MREIGGYLELENYHGSHYHEGVLRLNCGRGCLAYLIELRNISTIWLPDFLCDSVKGLCEREGVEVKEYRIGQDFLPVYDFSLESQDYLYLVDYYAQLTQNDIEAAKNVTENLVVDEVQGFFNASVEGVDTLYTCRKWFGVPDGAYLRLKDNLRLDHAIIQDKSCERMRFVLGRYESAASDYLLDSQNNNALFSGEPAKLMSKITSNLLAAVDYSGVIERRTLNWSYLNEAFSDVNELRISQPTGPFMYPLYLRDIDVGNMKRELASQGVYIPTLWPNVLEGCSRDSWSYKYAASILPLPVDQRYDERDMRYLVERVSGYL